MAWVWTVYLLRIYREANGCTDALAIRDHQQRNILEGYETFVYPTFVWVLWDMKHLRTSRMWPYETFELVIV